VAGGDGLLKHAPALAEVFPKEAASWQGHMGG
jgi:hypothetical protein